MASDTLLRILGRTSHQERTFRWTWRELQYSDSGLRVATPVLEGTHRKRQSRDTSRQVRLLNTIAAALTTGNFGEVFAAAFDKSHQMQLVLTKNGPPTPGDMGFAMELISPIRSPAVSYAIHSWYDGVGPISISGFAICIYLSEGSITTSRRRWRSMSRGPMLRLSFQVRAWGCGASSMGTFRRRDNRYGRTRVKRRRCILLEKEIHKFSSLRMLLGTLAS